MLKIIKVIRYTQYKFKPVVSYLFALNPFPDMHKTLIDLLQVFFMSLAYDSLPKRAAIGEGFLFIKITGMYFMLMTLKGEPESIICIPGLIKIYEIS